jgi:hypothetical protein
MSRGRQRVQQSDLTKTLRAVAAASVRATVKIDSRGEISVCVDGAVESQSPASASDPNEWAIDDDAH